MASHSTNPSVDHAADAARFIEDEKRTDWHDQALWFIRQKRDAAARSVDEWETLRELASAIKDHALSRLDDYLEEFERRAVDNGVRVHWAADADEHNRIVHHILSDRGAKKLVKSKSMLTEECELNPYLIARGIEVIDTDLGERIVQLRDEPPSHIVLPAIHTKKEEIGELFHEKLGTEEGVTDPAILTEAARQHLRQLFMSADASLTGVNFGIAETGGFVVCTNEGNADLGVHLAPVHIASMGIEKLIPRVEHLGVFQRLLARSGTGQPITVYSSHYHRPRPGQEMHLVLVDNGRSEHLGREAFRSSLKCIRCGACLNTCPIYRRSGGHSYGATIAGPIGSILNPGKDLTKYSTLPFASTLCGSCSDVCPVKIDIHEQLYAWRQLAVAGGLADRRKARAMRFAGRLFGNPKRYRRFGRWARSLLRWTPRRLQRVPPNTWGRARDLPASPKGSFRDWYVKNRSNP